MTLRCDSSASLRSPARMTQPPARTITSARLAATDRSRQAGRRSAVSPPSASPSSCGRGAPTGSSIDDWSWIEFRRTGVRRDARFLQPAPRHRARRRVPSAAGDSRPDALLAVPLLAAVGHVACATAVFAFARRRVGDAALLLAAPVVFLGAGWESVLEGFNAGITASLACGIAALLALDRGDRRGDRLACGCSSSASCAASSSRCSPPASPSR